MKKIPCLFLTAALLSSCLAVESKLSESSEPGIKRHSAKLFSVRNVPELDTIAIQSAVQSDPMFILLNHIVESGDSSIVMLTREECEYIGIPSSKYEQVCVYVDSLNSVAVK